MILCDWYSPSMVYGLGRLDEGFGCGGGGSDAPGYKFNDEYPMECGEPIWSAA